MSLPAPGIATSAIHLRDVAVVSPPPETLIYPWLTERLRQGAGAPLSVASERVFLSRNRNYAKQRIANNDEVERLFEDRGFAILTPESMSVADFVRAMSKARIVAGPSGGSLGNFLLAPGNCHQIHLMPEDFRNIFSGSSVLSRKFFGKYYYPLLDRITFVFGGLDQAQPAPTGQEHEKGIFGLDIPATFDLGAIDHAIMMAEKRIAIEDRLTR